MSAPVYFIVCIHCAHLIAATNDDDANDHGPVAPFNKASFKALASSSESRTAGLRSDGLCSTIYLILFILFNYIYLFCQTAIIIKQRIHRKLH